MPHPLTLLASLLYVASFTPWNQTWLIWVALVPWLIVLHRQKTIWLAVREGLYFGFFVSLLGFYWVATVLIHFSGLHWIFGVLGLFIYSWIGQPQLPIFALVYALLNRSGKLQARFAFLFLPLVYTAIDTLIPKLFVDTLGHSSYHWVRLRQLADVGGPALITFVMAAVNFGAFRAWLTRKDRKPAFGPLAASLVLAVLSWCYGAWRLEDIRTYLRDTKSRTLHVTAIQANIGDFEKLASEQGVRGAADDVLRTFFSLSDRALEQTPRPDLVVWPETSYPSTFRTPMAPAELARDQRLESYVRERHISLLFGGYDHHDGKDHNAMFLLEPAAGAKPGLSLPGDLQIYRKSILLLFGEYIPGAELFPWIKQTFPQVGNFGRGPGPQVVELKTSQGIVRAGPLICYEILFPYFVIQATRGGSEVVLNITNDSWFGAYGEPYLHLSLSVFRDIESRVPQVRATNTGITALIDATGEIINPSPLFTRMNIPMEVQLPSQPKWTLMKAWGDWFPKFAFFASLVILGLWWRDDGFSFKKTRRR